MSVELARLVALHHQLDLAAQVLRAMAEALATAT